MLLTTPIACSHHNHDQCIDDALSAAKELCSNRGVRLTDLRLQVLELIWQNHKPLGAYALMDMLAAASTRRVAPPTVYRALDFLLEQGLIHRINALNAFVGCPSPRAAHHNYFLICRDCGVAVEMDNPTLTRALASAAEAEGFSVESESVEIMGQCPSCRAGAAASDCAIDESACRHHSHQHEETAP